MCGIFGIIKNGKVEIEKKSIDAMLSSLSHRGPDDKGILELNNCVLGQTRLSIIDLSTGHQPMRDNEKKIFITFNGEIYNYKELKIGLERKGHNFSTNSDTEVIIKSYKEYGADCVRYLDGMFAFIIWDEEKELLFMARDRFGKKPLYYSYDNLKNLYIASEIKAIFASGKIKGEIDYGAISDYLALMYIPPSKTVYKNIFTLAPAEYGIYKNGKLENKKYWELKYKPIDITYDKAKLEIKKLFKEAVKKRLVADVEIGSFLSGGVDSTLVTVYAQKELSNPIKTFSLGYGGNRSELPYAKEAALKIGTDHYTLEANENLMDIFKESISYFDEPHADSSNFPQSILSKLAKEKVKVALSGDGADELFMGYGWYQKHLNLSLRKHPIEKLFLNPFQGYIKNISIFNESERKKVFGKNNKYVDSFLNKKISESSLSSVEKINLFDLTIYLPGQLLTKIDRMGMMHGLEVRSPFLDYKLAEFVYNLPTKFKMNKNENKIILKDILSEIMPKEFVYRHKQGFGAPVREWLKTPIIKNLVEEKLYTNKAMVYKFLSFDAVKEIIEGFYSKNDEKKNKTESSYYKVWVLLSLELWLLSHHQYHE